MSLYNLAFGLFGKTQFVADCVLKTIATYEYIEKLWPIKPYLVFLAPFYEEVLKRSLGKFDYFAEYEFLQYVVPVGLIAFGGTIPGLGIFEFLTGSFTTRIAPYFVHKYCNTLPLTKAILVHFLYNAFCFGTTFYAIYRTVEVGHSEKSL
jgi:hypothetical protein